MIKLLPLDTIADPTFREAYAKVVELYQHQKTSKLLQQLCAEAKFHPLRFLLYFHKAHTFTVLQRGFIASLYQQYEAHRNANARYYAGGDRNALIRILQEILEALPSPPTRPMQGAKGLLAQELRELQEGQEVFSRYLAINPALLDLLPADQKEGFVEHLDTLTSTYWRMFKEESAKLTLEDLR